jgi:hypothetical protein
VYAAVGEPRDELIEGLVDGRHQMDVVGYLNLVARAAQVCDDGEDRHQCTVSAGGSNP